MGKELGPFVVEACVLGVLLIGEGLLRAEVGLALVGVLHGLI